MRAYCVFSAVLLWMPPQLGAAEFHLLVGEAPRLYPGPSRLVPPLPGPGFPGIIADGDRLAGTSDVGDLVVFVGLGTPLFAPNQFGALSFTFRRGSIPVGGLNRVPILGIDFLGGPLLDLDGDLTNPTRSLVPVFGRTATLIPDSRSLIELVPSFDTQTIALVRVDATSTNEGGPSIPAEIATTVNVLAGTGAHAEPGPAINPSVDTRQGSLTPLVGVEGPIPGVYRVENLGYEIWQDSVDLTSGTAGVLGTFQFLGRFRGWLVVRNAVGGQFPPLTGRGLGTTLWPAVDPTPIGLTYQTANGLAGGSATILSGVSSDNFTIAGNGGLPLTDHNGDLGAYLDAVVLPRLDPSVHSFVYLESAGFGMNNSGDPVFSDTVGYDVVIVAASPCGIIPAGVYGDLDGDEAVTLNDFALFQACVGEPGVPASPGCEPADADADGDVDMIDFGTFQRWFGSILVFPECELQGPRLPAQEEYR